MSVHGGMKGGGLYSAPPNPRGVRGQSEQSAESERTVLGLHTDFFWQRIKPNLVVLVLAQSEYCPRTVRVLGLLLGQSLRTARTES